MSGVSVTIESLKNVKGALTDFQTDVDVISARINSDAEQVLEEVKRAVKEQENRVAELEDKVSKLINEIEQLQTNIITVNSKISELKSAIQDLERQKPQLEARLSQLERQRRELEYQRNNSEEDSSGYDSQIRAVDEQIRSTRRRLYELEDKIASAESLRAEAEVKLAQLKDEKLDKEEKLGFAKKELSRAKSKLERLASAGDAVLREVNNLTLAARRFEMSSSAASSSAKSGISKCITEIETYLAVNLGAGGASGGGIGRGFSSTSGGGTTASAQTESSPAVRSYPYSSSSDMSDAVYDSARGYQGNPEWNRIIRDGNTTSEIDAFRAVIRQHNLTENASFVRRASRADMGAELQNLPIEELVGRSYTFDGIMSASATQEMADAVSWGQNENIIYEITAPAGTSALDLTNLRDFQEVMFDAPTCRIESAEPCGYNTVRVRITIE